MDDVVSSSPRSGSPERLIGRDRELAACRDLLAGASVGGGALLLRGSPGVGKTALLRTCRTIAEARGLRVLSTAGASAETSFAFAGLQPLLLPVLAGVDALPEHLRSALLSALGLVEARVPSLPAVGLAVLELLTTAAEEAQLCLLIDDVQWLDTSSAEVVGFILRRVFADPIVLIAAGRDKGWPPPRVFPELRINPLPPDAAEALLTSVAPGMPLSVRRQVLDQARGNPLGLVELPRALPEAVGLVHFSAEVLPLTARLQATFVERALAISESARIALLVAALAPTATAAEVLAAASAVLGTAVHLSALDEAAREQLAGVGADLRVHFSHPLVRSALLHHAAPSRRQAAHAALADVLQDPERSIYHRAEATVGYDEELATELDRAALSAERRGSLAAAIDALDRASLLSTPGIERGTRLIRAAQLSFDVGDVEGVRRFIARTKPDELGRGQRATLRRLTLLMDDSNVDDSGPAYELIGLAEEALAAGDPDDALVLLESASSRIIMGEPGASTRRAIVASAMRVPVPMTDARVMAILAQAARVHHYADLAERLALLSDAEIRDPQTAQLVAFAALPAGDYGRSAGLLDRAESELRDQARLSLLPAVLTFRGVSAWCLGDWLFADECFDEAAHLASDTAQTGWLNQALAVQTGVAGCRGDAPRYRRLVEETENLLRQRNATATLHSFALPRGAGAAMLGRAEEAVSILGGLYDTTNPAFDARVGYDAFFYLADAAIASGNEGAVARAIDVMESVVPEPWPPVLQAGVNYARAVTAGADDADQLYKAALAGAAADRPFDLARTQLAYGRWLRRHRQPTLARGQLWVARDTFERLGNRPFVQRTSEELRASGDSVATPNHADWDELSPQEAQIARLVLQGLSNKEIGARLFLSPRTVGSHLYRMFPKLAITSRTQLGTVLQERL